MEILAIVGVLVVVGAIMLGIGQMRVDRPVSNWSDDELERQFPRFQRQVATLFTAGNTVAAERYGNKLKEIETEIAVRNAARATARELQLILTARPSTECKA